MTQLNDVKLLTLRTELAAEGHINDLEHDWLVALGATAGGKLQDMWWEVFDAAAIPAGQFNDRARAYIEAVVGTPPSEDYNAAWHWYWLNATLGPAPCGPPIDPVTIANLVAYYDARVPTSVWQDVARTIPAVNPGDPLRTWDDLSGGGRHMQNGGASNPAFSPTHVALGPAIVFAGSNQEINRVFFNFPMAQGMTVIQYLDTTSPGGWSLTQACLEYSAGANDGMRINAQSGRMATAWEIPPQMLATSTRVEARPVQFCVGSRTKVTNVTAGGPGFPITGDWENNLWLDGVNEGSGPVRLGATENDSLAVIRIGGHGVFGSWVGGIQRTYIYDRYLNDAEMCGAQEWIKANP